MKLEDVREVLCMKEDAMSKLKKLRLVNIYKNTGGVIKDLERCTVLTTLYF